MLKMIIIAGAALAMLVTTAHRMVGNRTTPLLMWLLLVASAALLVTTGNRVLFPGEPADTARVNGPGSVAMLEVPPGHALLVTAELADFDDEEARKADDDSTHYVVTLQGDVGEQKLRGAIRRKVEQGEKPLSLDGEAGLKDRSRPTLISLHENLQDRYRLEVSGAVTVKVRNWSGGAAEALRLDVVPAPLPKHVFWISIAVLCSLALVSDRFLRTDRLAADVGFLSFASLFVSNEVMPADGLRDLIFSLALGMVVGALLIGGVGSLLERGSAKEQKPPPRARTRADSTPNGG